MSQTTEIVAHVVSGVVHSLRVSLYREWGVPYPWLRKSPMVRFKTDRAWPQAQAAALAYRGLHDSNMRITRGWCNSRHRSCARRVASRPPT